MRRHILLAVVLWFGSACLGAWNHPLSCWATPSSLTYLHTKQQLRSIVLNKVKNTGWQVGIYVKLLDPELILFNFNGDLPLIPASNQKILTTLVALDLLGPDFRYTTKLMASPNLAHGVLPGNLVIQGSGDPTFCYPYNTPSTRPLIKFAQVLKNHGVKRISGDIVADDSAFDREFIGQGWYERYLLDPYAAPVSALSLNANTILLTITAPQVTFHPYSPTVTLTNQLRLTQNYTQVWVERKAGTAAISIKGNIVPGKTLTRCLTITNPPLFTAGSMLTILKQTGITVDGVPRVVSSNGEAASFKHLKIYAKYVSPPLKELIYQTNRESDNFFAQHIFKTVAEYFAGYGTAVNGEQAIKDFFKRNHIESTGLRLVDGSGLSTLNRITPRQLAEALSLGYTHREGQILVDSLPAPGEGTLRYRLSGVPVRAKTGTLQGHTALSGYVKTSDNRIAAFSIIINNVTSLWKAIEFEDQLVKIVHEAGAPQAKLQAKAQPLNS